jgi:hypothetical protein
MYHEATKHLTSTKEAFDNSKNPAACFEGPGSIFREHGEKLR